MTQAPDLPVLVKQFCEELWREWEAQRPLSPAIRYRWQGAMKVLCELYGEEPVQQALAQLWRERFGQLDGALAQHIQRLELPAQAAAAPVYPSAGAGQA